MAAEHAQAHAQCCPVPAGRDLVLYQIGGAVYCSQAASTAYEFPLIDANIDAGGADGPEITVCLPPLNTHLPLF